MNGVSRTVGRGSGPGGDALGREPRLAKMEAGDPSISLDLLLRAFSVTGATKRDLARVLTSRRWAAAA